VYKKPVWRPRYPAYETPARPARRSFATTGIPVDAAMDLTVAARAALLEMIDYLEATHGFAREAAYALCSAAVDLHVSEVVDVPYPLVSALLPLDVFDEGQADGRAQSRSGTA
jgi:formamidase